jgi:hypothetical protein
LKSRETGARKIEQIALRGIDAVPDYVKSVQIVVRDFGEAHRPVTWRSVEVSDIQGFL